jgi:hypothetical protein
MVMLLFDSSGRRRFVIEATAWPAHAPMQT